MIQPTKRGWSIFNARAMRDARSATQESLHPELAPIDRVDWTQDQWETPWPLVRSLEEEFGAFDLDPCTTPEAAKAPVGYTPLVDGLRLSWFGRVFCNPPYSDVVRWIQKAITESEHCFVVMLLPVRTDRDWWHDLVQPHASELRFLRGRQRFIGRDGRTVGRPVFASVLVMFGVPR